MSENLIPPALEQTHPPTPPPAHDNAAFFGRFGLRAGWGMSIYVMIWLVATVIASIFALGATGQMNRMMQAQAQHGKHASVHVLFTSLFVAVNDGVPLLAMLGASWLFARGERRLFRTYGLGVYRWKDAFAGAAWGLLLMSALVGLLVAIHALVFDSRALSGAAILSFGIKWLFAFTLVGAAEEYAFRGYMQFTLMRGVWGLGERLMPANPRAVAFWIAATLMSFLFAALHLGNHGETPFGLVIVFAAGMTFAYALWRTGSLWWGLGFHATWDWAQSFLFGVPDSGNISVGRLFITHPQGNPFLSGGSDGPEGSFFVVLALALAVLLIRFTTSPGAQPSVEQAPVYAAPTDIASAGIS